MPGPGGGGHGGGGGRGGSFGGGGHGGGGFGGGRPGGFHGGPHPHPHRPFMGGWGWWGRPYGGGCLGGLMSMIFVPIIIAILLIVFVVGSLTGSVTWDNYNEEAFQDYANSKYYEYFDGEADMEDQLLIVFLTYEDYYQYSYIAWSGDHIDSRIDDLLGNEYTELGRLMTLNIANEYKYSLGKNLAEVVDDLTEKIDSFGLESSFDDSCKGDHGNATGKFVNNTSLSVSKTTVETALTEFAEATGISVVLLVEDNTVVFGTNNTPRIIAIVLLIVVAVIVVAAVMNRKKRQANASDDRYNDRYNGR